MSAATRSLEAGSSFPAYEKIESASVTRRLDFFGAALWQKSAPSAQWTSGTRVGGGAFPRSREQFPGVVQKQGVFPTWEHALSYINALNHPYGATKSNVTSIE